MMFASLNLPKFSPATVLHSMIFWYSIKTHSLNVELAAVVDTGKLFVEVTYKLEDDSILVPECLK